MVNRLSKVVYCSLLAFCANTALLSNNPVNNVSALITLVRNGSGSGFHEFLGRYGKDLCAAVTASVEGMAAKIKAGAAYLHQVHRTAHRALGYITHLRLGEGHQVTFLVVVHPAGKLAYAVHTLIIIGGGAAVRSRFFGPGQQLSLFSWLGASSQQGDQAGTYQ